MAYGLPVLMYHHINNHAKDLVTITPDDFDNQMAFLSKKGYKTLDTQEALACLKGEKKLTGKEVLITFDDGFLDNWVYAYPILQKYRLKAVLFLATCFVEARGSTRPHLGDAWKGKISAAQLPKINRHRFFDYNSVIINKDSGTYLRWSELQQMEADRVFDVQPHTHFHGECFTSDKIIRFNANPHDKLAMTTQGDNRIGIPIYESRPAVMSRRYNDDPGLRDFLANYVEGKDKKTFFKRPKEEWHKELQTASAEYIRKNDLHDSYETPAEYEQRVKDDLELCKSLIESKLNKKCLTVAWPWGEYNEQVLKWAKELGYEAAFTTQRGTNDTGSDLMRLNRCVVKKGDVNWFSQQLYIYSHPKVSNFYLKIRRKF